METKKLALLSATLAFMMLVAAAVSCGLPMWADGEYVMTDDATKTSYHRDYRSGVWITCQTSCITWQNSETNQYGVIILAGSCATFCVAFLVAIITMHVLIWRQVDLTAYGLTPREMYRWNFRLYLALILLDTVALSIMGKRNDDRTLVSIQYYNGVKYLMGPYGLTSNLGAGFYLYMLILFTSVATAVMEKKLENRAKSPAEYTLPLVRQDDAPPAYSQTYGSVTVPPPHSAVAAGLVNTSAAAAAAATKNAPPVDVSCCSQCGAPKEKQLGVFCSFCGHRFE